MQQKDRAREESRLIRALKEIDTQLKQMQIIEGDFTKNMRTAYKNMWEEVSSAPNDMKNMDQLVQAKLYLDEMRNLETTYKTTEKRIVKLKKMKNSPYFARIDFIENGESEIEEIYIGISMVQNEESLEILIYDWRAPISSMFYDCDTGNAGFDSPTGRVEGKLTLKRQFKIENGQMKYMFDSDVKIDDDVLQEVLGQSKDEKMKTIITSIQREQNRAIRDEGHKLLIVEGPAGSGKTSIALHRAAFLLYRYRDSISNDTVVILSPNEMFNDYISDVLPELGEENVKQTTFMEFSKNLLKTRMKVTDLNEQMEYILTSKGNKEYDIRIKAIQYKSSIEFLEKLEKYVEHLLKRPWEFEDINVLNTMIITKEEQKSLFQRDYTYLPMIPRLKKIKNRVLYLIKQHEHKQIEAIFQRLSNNPSMSDYSPGELKRIATRMVLKEFKLVRQKAREIGNTSVINLYKRMYTRKSIIGEQNHGIAKFTLAKFGQGILLYEDLAPMLYLKAKLHGVTSEDNIQHMIIDEAQDYTPLQIKIINELFPESNFTVVGDLNQSLNPYANIGDGKALGMMFNTESLSHIKLTKSYRSTQQITRFVNSILEIEQEGELINRKGKLPTVEIISSIDECLQRLNKEIINVISKGFSSIAVIAKNNEEAKVIYKTLSKYIKCNLILSADTSFPQGITIMPSYLSKGLEFDVVFVLNLTNPYSGKEERNLFYTICSRALHRLYIYSLNELPEYINGIPQDIYRISTIQS